MSSKKDTTHIRIYQENMRDLWDNVTFENKTIADVIEFLIKVEKETREYRQSLQAKERAEQEREILAKSL